MEAVEVGVVNVKAEVAINVIHVAEALATCLIWIGLLTGVNALVNGQFTVLDELFAAFFTLIWSVARVDAFVLNKCTRIAEPLAAHVFLPDMFPKQKQFCFYVVVTKSRLASCAKWRRSAFHSTWQLGGTAACHSDTSLFASLALRCHE